MSSNLGFSNQLETKQDLSFSSPAEIQSFVKANLNTPSQASSTSVGITKLIDINGTDIGSQPVTLGLTVNYFQHGLLNFLLNPIAFDGSVIKELQDSYRTNEVGFFIGLCSILTVMQQFATHRRSVIRLQKKRLVYQTYLKSRFL